jgi:hypothetical protein
MRLLLRFLAGIGLALLVLIVLLFLPVFSKIDLARATIPPGADTVQMAVNPDYHTNVVGRIFLGNEYRALWAEPIPFAVLDLDRFDGGLMPVREGSGQETRSLHFDGRNGGHFSFRSIDKETHRLLVKTLSRTPIAWLAHDQTSSSFPAGAIPALALQEAVGLPSGPVRLVVLPDSDRLGKYRESYAGLVGMLQDNPSDYLRRFPGVDSTTRLVESEELLPLLDGSAAHRPDAAAFLTARLLDLFLNDWDRHEGQWRWAGFPEPWGTRWLPVPVDRDRAFSWYDGILLRLARLRAPELTEFGPSYPAIAALTKNSGPLDRRLLAGLDRPAWDSIAALVAARLSDSAIAASIGRLPSAYQRLAGAKLEQTLRLRRDGLAGIADEFYGQLAHAPEIRGTASGDFYRIIHHPDGDLEVRIARKEAGAEGADWFSRRFDPGETAQIDLYSGGGDDRMTVSGSPVSPIVLRKLDRNGRALDGSAPGDTAQRTGR